jgi:hypothetical protein
VWLNTAMLLLTTWLTACSGGDPTTPAGDPQGEDAVHPQIQCAEGRSFSSQRTAQGEEQYCDRGGVMDGPYLRLYPDGTKAVKGTYANNLMDGDWWEWYPNGQEAYKGKFVKNKKAGPWTWWYENGQRKEEGDYLQNRKAGQWTSWYETGAKKEEGLYHNDVKNGLWNYYNNTPENTVAKTEKWENGAVTETKGTEPITEPPADGAAPVPAPPSPTASHP